MERHGSAASSSMTQRFLLWCAHAWEAAIEGDEIAALDEETIRQIASDCAIGPDDLLQLAKAGPHASDEMMEMMRALNVDPADVATLHPPLFREMQITCSKCSAKSRCREDLAKHSAAAEYGNYCANGPTLSAMRADVDLMHS